MTASKSSAVVFRKRRGVTASGYGLIVGLISVLSLAAISSVGSQVDFLFDDVGDNLASAGAAGQLGAAGSEAPPVATATPTPVPGQLLWASGDGSAMDIAGPSSTNSRCEVFTLTNTGELGVTGLAVNLSSLTYYSTGCSSSPADTCPSSGGTLAAGDSCTVSVRATADDNVASMTANLRASATGDGAGGSPVDAVAALEGEASGFPVPTDLTGLGVRFTSSLQGSGGAAQGYCVGVCSPTFSGGIVHLSGGPPDVDFRAVAHHNSLNDVFMAFTGDHTNSNIKDLSLSCLRSGTSTPIVQSIAGADNPSYSGSSDITSLWLNVTTPDFNPGETWDCYLVP